MPRNTAGRLRKTTTRDEGCGGRQFVSNHLSPPRLTTQYDIARRAAFLPGGAVRTTIRHLDGRTKSVTGTAVSTTQYSVTAGRPFLASQPGQADTLHEYDALGNRVRSGLDVNGDGQLTLLSDDRINDSDTVYEQDANDHWWRVSTSTTYAGDDPDTPEDERDDPVVTSVRRQRLTGLGTAAPAPYSGILTAESRSEDIHGNLTAVSAGQSSDFAIIGLWPKSGSLLR